MSTKSLYPLIGANSEKVDWIVTSSLRPDLAFPVNGQNSFLSATHYPLLKKEQIPLKWLKTDPGFPILLIESNELDLPWIYHPYDQKKNHFQLRQEQPQRRDNFLIVLEETATTEEINFLDSKYPGKKTFIYRDKDNFDMIKNDSRIFDSYLFCFQSFWRPDVIIFQDPRFNKCLRPQIVHAIHLGGVIETDYWEKEPVLKEKLWYGTWELFHG